MEKELRPIKILHEGETRKIKEVATFEQFLSAIKHKIKINPEKYELSYIDKDNDEISLSTSTDFEEYLRSNERLPKIELKRVDSDFDKNPVIQNIQMTMSTFERPVLQNEDEKMNSQDNSDKNIGQEENSESLMFKSFERAESPEESKIDIQIEEPKVIEQDKYSEDFDNKSLSNSVQTQSVIKANASTDVANLILNHDQDWNTDIKETHDKSNQQVVDVVDHGIDPFKSLVNDQAVNADLSQPKMQLEDENLVELIRSELKQLQPVIIKECQEFIKNSLSENQQKDLLSVSVHHVACNRCLKCPIVGIRYKCIQCNNVDFCSECEELANHPHPVLKIRSDEALENYMDSLKTSKIMESSISSSIFQSLMSTNRFDERDLKESQFVKQYADPVIEEVKKEEGAEFPEMVKRSYLAKYERFSDEYLSTLKAKNISKGMLNINCNCDTFILQVKVHNSDVENCSRWPINSALLPLSTTSEYFKECEPTIKEIKAGVYHTFNVKLSCPKKPGKYVFQFKLVDEYGRKFGDQINIEVNAIDANIVQQDEQYSAFDDVPENEPELPHKADIKYPDAIKKLKNMGLEMDQKMKDVVVECSGKIEDVFEKISL